MFKNLKTDGETIADDVTAILSVFDEDQIAEFFSIILKVDNVELCKDISLVDVSRIILFIAGDIGSILKNAKGAIGIIVKQTGTMPAPKKIPETI